MRIDLCKFCNISAKSLAKDNAVVDLLPWTHLLGQHFRPPNTVG